MTATKTKKEKATPGDHTVAVNRRGRFDFDIHDSFETGLVLTGTEVKSARQGQVQIAEAYATLEAGPHRGLEVWVHGLYIAPYEQGHGWNPDSRRRRKLLLHRDQINRLMGQVQQKGFALIPLKFYFTRGRAKLELGLGKGRKVHDKRQAIAARETKRDISRELSRS